MTTLRRLICWIRGHRFGAVLEIRDDIQYAKCQCLRCDALAPADFVGWVPMFPEPTSPPSPSQSAHSREE
jgi:hypothetical protein